MNSISSKPVTSMSGVMPRRGSETSMSNPKINDILAKLEIENKIKEGAENLLQVFDSRKLEKESKESLKQQIESQLDAANAKIQLLQSQLNGISRSTLELSATLVSNRQEGSDQEEDDDKDEGENISESPTWSLGDLLESLENSQDEWKIVVSRANDLVGLLQRHPLLKYDLVMNQFGDRIRSLLLSSQTQVIACGYRILRYSITDLSSIQKIRANLKIDYLMIKTLSKEHAKYQLERIQAIKFIRSFLDLNNGVEEISVGVIKALLSICDSSNNEDKLKNICIETLSEILVLNPKKLLQVPGGSVLGILLQNVIDSNSELSIPIIMSIMHGIDMPQKRKFFNFNHLEILLSPFTDYLIKPESGVNNDRIMNCAKILSTVLRTWTGLYAMSINDFNCIRILVDCLTIPIPSLLDVIFDLLFSIFRIRPLVWSSSFLAGRRLTNIAHSNGTNHHSQKNEVVDSRLSDHYTALVLQVFIKCGLIDKLVMVLEYNNNQNHDSTNFELEQSIIRKATLLLSEILSLLSKLHPTANKNIEQIIMLPNLFDYAISSHLGTSIFQIDKISRNINKTTMRQQQTLVAYSDTTKTSNNSSGGSSSSSSRIGSQIDESTFKQLIIDTQVLNTKSFTKWNWDLLLELIQGPLLNSKRLEEAIKTTKFMKRLISFYRPFKYRFSSIKRTKPNQKYIHVGKALLNTLLQNPEGIKYLTENKLLRQIAECLAQLDPMSGIISPEPLFSSQRLQHTLSYGYFELLGTLSSNPNGIQMLERWRMFNMFYHLTELKQREDLITNFIVSMDYKFQGHARIVLSKTLTTCHKDLRLFATNYLRSLLKSSNADTQKWIVELLVIQLYDPSMEVCKCAVEVLEEYCEISENLEHFIGLQPSLGHLGDIGTPLLLRFLSTSSGFKYLKDLDYVSKEMDNWFHGQNDNYVLQIEEYLESINSTWIPDSCLERQKNSNTNNSSNSSNFDEGYNMMPRHFYGELTLTEEGCSLLQSKGHFKIFADYVAVHKDEDQETEIITKLKGCLWALGNIGSNRRGAPFFLQSTNDENDKCNVIQDIVHISQNSTVLNLKGTAIFALGLISSTLEGIEILDEYGWQCVLDGMGRPKGLCLPKNLSVIFHGGDNLDEKMIQDDEEIEFVTSNDSIKSKIILEISNLSNQILANEASKQLVKLESKYPKHFQSVDLFLDVMKLLEKYKFKLPIRRFIFELFDSNQLIEKMMVTTKKERRSRHLSETK